MTTWLSDLWTENHWVRVLAGVLIVGNLVPGLVAFLVWLERRVAAWIQDRVGPNRVGPFGLLQSIADLVKFIFKEDVTPGHVNKPMFLLAPALAVIPPLVVMSLIPFSENLYIADVDAGILAVFAFSSIGVYALALGGWSSNSKYALLGGVRASAQMVSYEICLGLSALAACICAGSLRLKGIVIDQSDGLLVAGIHHDGFLAKFFDWNLWKQPVGAVIFMVAGFAETNRLPFDLPEAESELAALDLHVRHVVTVPVNWTPPAGNPSREARDTLLGVGASSGALPNSPPASPAPAGPCPFAPRRHRLRALT